MFSGKWVLPLFLVLGLIANTLYLSADTRPSFLNQDTDGDGIWDVIELQYGLNPQVKESFTRSKQPNIIFILVDDLGFGDLGKFHQDSRTGVFRFDTPQLDKMAEEGAMLTHHYVSAPVCAPSRASFLQGLHQGHSTVRDNQFDKELANNQTVATMLRQVGYHTAVVGKYGLAGGRTSQLAAHPLKRGFDEFFGYLFHNQGHEHYPRNGTTDKIAFLYEGYDTIRTGTDKTYTTDVFTARAKKIIVENHTQRQGKPLFLYLSYDTPHSRQQVASVEYPEGRGVNKGLQWTGPAGTPAYVNTAVGNIDSWIHPDARVSQWAESSKKHVSMIRRIDDSVEDIIQTLKDLGIDDNTLLVFTSDNGPTIEGVDPRVFASYGGFDGIKRDLWEGGIRVPTIARWPGKISANQVCTTPSGLWDWLPTFLEAAGQQKPAYTDGYSLLPALTNPLFSNGTALPAAKIYRNDLQHRALYWEYFVNNRTPNWTEFLINHRDRQRNQMQAIRIGRYKGVRYNLNNHATNFEIYDVVNDPQEKTNLAATMPELQQRMKDQVLRSRNIGGEVTRPYDTEFIPAMPIAEKQEAGINWELHEVYTPWISDFTTRQPLKKGVSAAIESTMRPSGQEEYGLYFEGFLEVPSDGVYTFILVHENPFHLMIHDIHLLNQDFRRSAGGVFATIRLKAGKHPVRLFYQHLAGTGHPLQLEWVGPGILRAPVPASAFSHLPSTTTPTRAVSIQETGLQVVPNKSLQQILWRVEANAAEAATARVYNLKGQLLHQESVKLLNGLNQHRIAFQNQARGIYLLELQTASGVLYREKWMW